MPSFTLLQYQTDPPYQPTLLDDQGNPFDYTGYAPTNFALKLYNALTNSTVVGAGSFSVDVVNNALAYQWAASDTDSAGTWILYLNVTMLSGFERRYEDTLYIDPAIP